eukprot:2381426-Prymnesium_polylepis.2
MESDVCAPPKQNDGIDPRCLLRFRPGPYLRALPSCLPCSQGSQGNTPILLMRTLRLFVLVFEVIGLLLLVNLLIAMMASSYERARASAKITWRLQITRLVLRLELFLPYIEPGIGYRTWLRRYVPCGKMMVSEDTGRDSYINLRSVVHIPSRPLEQHNTDDNFFSPMPTDVRERQRFQHRF